MTPFVSPLRYPGGKLKVVDYLKRIFEVNDLCDGVYIEPYAGGASVALSLLFSEYAREIRINDIDLSIYAFWHSVLHDTDALCRMIADTPVTIDIWHRQHDIQKDKANADPLTLGFSTFFLNRANRSGILSAGVIGGQSQSGKFKIDARFNKADLISRIQNIAEYAERIKLTRLDAVELLKIQSAAAEKSLCYLDPPYYVKGRDLYLNYYNDQDHQLIAQAVSKYRGKWLMSYDAAPFITNLYKAYRQCEYYLSYSAGNPARGREVMIYSDELVVPDSSIIKNSRN